MSDDVLQYFLCALLPALVCAGVIILRLHRQLRRQRDIVAAVSHDLRSSLTRLRLRVDLLSDETARRGLYRVIDDIQSMARGALDFSRDAAADEASRRVALDTLLESLCTDMAEEGYAVTWHPPAHGFVITGRPVALRRGFQNLIQNALKYGESADVSMSANGDMVETTVRDRGPGIPEQELAKVLAPFYRLDKPGGHRISGVGLGLPIVQNVMSAHGGSLLLHNHVEGGLVARVMLPLLQPPTRYEKSPGNQAPAAMQTQSRV